MATRSLLLSVAVIGVSMCLVQLYVGHPAGMIMNIILGILLVILCLRLAGVRI